MTPERKRKVADILTSVATRITIVDEMIHGIRPANDVDARRYMKEVKNGLDKINEIIEIS